MSVMPTYAEAIFGIINLTEEVEYHKDRADRLAVIADALAVENEDLTDRVMELYKNCESLLFIIDKQDYYNDSAIMAVEKSLYGDSE